MMKINDAIKFSDTVVKLLKEERLRLGVSQYKLAKDCDISKSSISYIESNKQVPTIKSLVIISAYLGISLGDLIKKAEFAHKISAKKSNYGILYDIDSKKDI